MCEKNERNKDEFNKGFLSRLFADRSRNNIQITPKKGLQLDRSEWFVGQNDKQEQKTKSIFGWMAMQRTMHKYISIALILFCAAIFFTVGCSSSGASKEQSSQSNPPASTVSAQTQSKAEVSIVKAVSAELESQSKAEIAIGEASKENRYLYLVFYKQNDPKSEEMKQAVAQAQKEVSAKADVAYVDFVDKSEQALLGKWGIDESLIPITLVIAPNGAIVKGFSGQVTSDNLTKAFVSPKMAEIIKATQDQKLIYLYVANLSLKYYKENLATIQATADTDFKGSVQIIEVDPQDKGEATLIEQCKVNIPVNEPNLLILNGGYIVGRLTGNIDRQTLVQTTTSGCSGGSCCPAAK
jgi:hypothetical protein